MAKKVKDPGFGYSSFKNAKSIINNDGTSNVVHLNRKKSLDDLYTYFTEISWIRFFALVISLYTLLNIFFAFIYVAIGIEQITPSKGTFWEDVLNGFFFSAQTLTTVGYGGIAPQGLLANIIAAFEAMIGLLGFSFITGLLYGRFSKPRAAIKFSEKFIVRDFKDQKALMFRLMNSRKTVMIEPEITVMLSITDKEASGDFKRNFYQLKLERNKIMYLPTIWTVVHPIVEESPLYKYLNTDLEKLDAELYILLNYHEESFAQKVYNIHSYKFDKLVKDVQFEPSFTFDEEGNTVLDHDKLNNVNPM
ncbi:MAG: ion transporter [Flavobacteriaceae bacterium]